MNPPEDLQHIADEDLLPVSDIDIRALANIYDEKDVYLSVYLPVSGRENEHLNKIFVDSRVSAIRKALSPELWSEFQDTLDMVETYLSESPLSGERGRIIFASSSNSFLNVYHLAVEPERSLVIDTSPYLLPLAKLRADYDDYGVLLVDSQEAKFTCIRSDLAEEKKHLSTDLMNKHKKGGWSQMRFNHLRKGAIKSFLLEVSDSVQGTCDQLQTRGLVIAGPGEAKQQLMEMLPQAVQQKVLGIIDVPIDIPRDELVEAGDAVLQESEHSEARRMAEELKSAILKGGLAVHGIEAVRDALEQARVNTLLILKDSSVPGWLCEKCQNLQSNANPPENCDRCGGPTSDVDVVEELYELAQRTGAKAVFAEKEDFLDSDDVVGALLRY